MKQTKKAEINILLIGVILVAVITVGTLFYSILHKPAITDYEFETEEFFGEETVLLGEKEPTPVEIPKITVTGFVVGVEKPGGVEPKTEFELGEIIIINSRIEKFRQAAVDDRYAYAMEQWVATQDENGEYITALTAMTANFSKYTDAPVDNIELTNKLDSSYLSPGQYTIKMFVVDRFTQDISLKEKRITII